MLFLMLATYRDTPDEALLKAHVDWLLPKFERGAFLLSGGLDAVPGRAASAAAIIVAASREQALDLLSDEPFHVAGVVEHDIIPFHPRVRKTDLDTLFDVPDILYTVE